MYVALHVVCIYGIFRAGQTARPEISGGPEDQNFEARQPSSCILVERLAHSKLLIFLLPGSHRNILRRYRRNTEMAIFGPTEGYFKPISL